jgi:vacuolar protein sorting-associated protein 29
LICYPVLATLSLLPPPFPAATLFFSMLILILGDYYIPSSESDIPIPFKKLLVPGKISAVFSTGNLDRETLQYLSTISNQVINIRGKLDSLKTKDSQTIEFLNFKFGIQNSLMNDHFHLEGLARKLDVDVLITGGSHEFKAYEKDKRFYIDPGSITGAFKLELNDVVPSFVLMDLGTMGFSLYIYKLINDVVKVEKMDFNK